MKLKGFFFHQCFLAIKNLKTFENQIYDRNIRQSELSEAGKHENIGKRISFKGNSCASFVNIMWHNIRVSLKNNLNG